MSSGWQVDALIELVRLRYEDWSDFEYPLFVADEIEYKQKAVAQAADWLSQAELDRLIGTGDVDIILERINKIAKMTNLMFVRMPKQGDTAVLHTPDLDKATFCTQFRNLLHADRPSLDRLQTFSNYLTSQNLPNKWPFPTYFLFLCDPQNEIFVKPRTAVWFLKFMGKPEPVSAPPSADTYANILKQIGILKEAFATYGLRDQVDLQSIIWIGYREAKARIGRLDMKGQIDLDVPRTNLETVPTSYEITPQTAVLRETSMPHQPNPEHSLEQIHSETGFTTDDLSRWLRAIERKKQVVFYGPPGTGKTFIAQHLARHLIGGGDGFTELVQFHPAYAYEDFMQGIRPFTQADGTLGYEMKDGRFLQFCQKAQERSDLCILVVDEINRANLASVFGELMYLLEYRNEAIQLAGGGNFSIPDNVRILATMNTADRSIALVDHALRRRFAFIHLAPNYDLLRHYHQQTDYDPSPLISILDRLNKQINDPHYQLGTTFFMHPNLANQLQDIWQMEVEPYLEEYFFDQPDQIDTFRWQKLKL